MILVGDIHGHFKRALTPAKENPNEIVIQLGDFGIFNERDREFIQNTCPSNLRFLAGNHDNRFVMSTMPGYLNSGWHEDLGVFVVNGAFSVDYRWRYSGYDWFEWEEHTEEEFDKLRTEFFKVKPKIVLSHDGPGDFVDFILRQ
jgi:hypothetical protein